MQHTAALRRIGEGDVAHTWRNDAKVAGNALAEALKCNSSWIDLLMADAKLKEAKEAIISALTRLNMAPTVTEAKKHVRLTPKR